MRIENKNLSLLLIVLAPFFLFPQNKYNLNFDDFNPEKQKIPKGWFKWGFYENLSGEKIDSNNIVGKVVADSKGRFGCITYKIPANYSGDTIQLSGKIKFENVKDYVGLLMRIDGYATSTTNKSLGFKSMQSQKIRGTSDWKEYSIKLPYPKGAKWIYLAGILGKTGTAWFDDFNVTIDGKDIQTLEETQKILLSKLDSIELKSALSKSATKFDFTNDKSLDALIDKIGSKKVVAIGESTHGTSEFYQLREILTKRLIKEKGFNLVVLENPYDDIELFNKYLLEDPLDNLIRKHLFPIYQTEEMKSFLQWYKDYQIGHKIDFKGCDDSFWVFDELLTSLTSDISDKKLNGLVKILKMNAKKGSNGNFKKELKFNALVYGNLVEIEKHLKHTNNLNKKLAELLFNVKGSYVNYLNVTENNVIVSRDEQMAERVSYFVNDENRKVILWAHNAHISKEIIVGGDIGLMGKNLTKEYAEDFVSIGLSTLKGTYSYIEEKLINENHDYKEPLFSAPIKSNDEFYWENAFALSEANTIYDFSELNNLLETDEIIGSTKLIGYGKESKSDDYYIPMIKHFDYLLFLKETKATTPIFR